MTDMFRSLRNRNYRLWAAGSLLSNVGTWVQRIAQDWLVLAELTHQSASALGIVTALQFVPIVALLPWSGYAADRIDKRSLLIVTQACSCLLAVGLGILALSGMARLWHVYVFALLLGCVNAFDAPVRQTFVSELVGEEDLANAVALNSTSFNAARMIGPAFAGVIIAAVGSGGAFLINGASFLAAIASLLLLRKGEIRRERTTLPLRGNLLEGFRYVWRDKRLRAVLLMLFLIGSFGLNFPVFISTMSVTEFGSNAGRYGLLMSIMAVGSIAGAFLTAREASPGMGFLLGTAVLFGLGLGLGAIAPNYWLFAATLTLVGGASVAFTTATSSYMQLATEPTMRGRVMAIRLAVAMGGTPVGAPLVGWAADMFGPRSALLVGAASGFASAVIAMRHMKDK